MRRGCVRNTHLHLVKSPGWQNEIFDNQIQEEPKKKEKKGLEWFGG
jgi:hypothetical protein